MFYIVRQGIHDFNECCTRLLPTVTLLYLIHCIRDFSKFYKGMTIMFHRNVKCSAHICTCTLTLHNFSAKFRVVIMDTYILFSLIMLLQLHFYCQLRNLMLLFKPALIYGIHCMYGLMIKSQPSLPALQMKP